jgi:putative SOS response-associated peptidase YedK
MCYSNSSTSTTLQLAERYQKLVPGKPIEIQHYFASGFEFPQWPIITKDATIEQMRWGLLPHWFAAANWTAFAAKTLNARIETCSEKASFKHLIQSKRCIVPSNGFFDWQAKGKHKIPFYIRSKEQEIFSIAGLFDTWLDPRTGIQLQTFTLLTTQANELMAHIHNVKQRMPVVLSAAEEQAWLSGALTLAQIIDRNKIQLEAWEIDKKIIKGPQANSALVSQPNTNYFEEQMGLFD